MKIHTKNALVCDCIHEVRDIISKMEQYANGEFNPVSIKILSDLIGIYCEQILSSQAEEEYKKGDIQNYLFMNRFIQKFTKQEPIKPKSTKPNEEEPHE